MLIEGKTSLEYVSHFYYDNLKSNILMMQVQWINFLYHGKNDSKCIASDVSRVLLGSLVQISNPLREFLKNSYIQIKKCYGLKLVRAAKQSELKRCSK